MVPKKIARKHALNIAKEAIRRRAAVAEVQEGAALQVAVADVSKSGLGSASTVPGTMMEVQLSLIRGTKTRLGAKTNARMAALGMLGQ